MMSNGWLKLADGKWCIISVRVDKWQPAGLKMETNGIT